MCGSRLGCNFSISHDALVPSSLFLPFPSLFPPSSSWCLLFVTYWPNWYISSISLIWFLSCRRLGTLQNYSMLLFTADQFSRLFHLTNHYSRLPSWHTDTSSARHTDTNTPGYVCFTDALLNRGGCQRCFSLPVAWEGQYFESSLRYYA